MADMPGSNETSGPTTGQPLTRFEDADLLLGRGRFGDDLPVPRGTLHAAILRSPHAHAELLSVDAAAALAMPGVACVVTGEDAQRWTRPFAVAVKTAMQQWCMAVDRVRYVGEPVAVVLARDRYIAEDAVEQIAVEYRPLPAVVDPEAAALSEAPLLHPAVGSNIVSDRSFRYGAPGRDHYPVSAQCGNADRDLCRTRRAPPGRGYLRGHRQFPGPARDAPGHGVGARRPGQPAAPADATRFWWQLWSQARGVSVHRADGIGGAQSRPAGQMGRNAARTPHRGDFRHQSRHEFDGRGG
jgi:hypothetical protein